MFIYKDWDKFCKNLQDTGYKSEKASSIIEERKNNKFLVLKHDVETNPSKALILAEIENKYGHKGSYYVQAYLLNTVKNVEILKKIKGLGHEVTYHHDVMDSNGGDIGKAKIEFRENLIKFEKHGFKILTVCQHGNPVIVRNGYHSNRDFFRNKDVKNEFSYVTEIMVDFKNKIKQEYKYISDSGYGWKVIFDPENNDLLDSSEKDKKLKDLKEVVEFIKANDRIIISTHPHRWSRNNGEALFVSFSFKVIKFIVKLFLKIPGVRKIMGKFYFLAKKI